MSLEYVEDGRPVWEYEDPPESGQWKLLPPDHQKLCTHAVDNGFAEISGHDNEDCDAERDYDFSDETVRLYRGRLCRCTWSVRSEISRSQLITGTMVRLRGLGRSGWMMFVL